MTGRAFLPLAVSTVLTGALLLGSAPAAWAVSPLAVAETAGEVALAPHKALYDVELIGSKTGSQIINIRGKMYFEWKPSCEGWITNHRFTLAYDYADNQPLTISSDFTTFETFDGKSLDFSSRRKKDGETYEELRGKAFLDKEGGSGTARYSIPDGLDFALPAGIAFPTTHTTSLVKKAREGAKFYKVTTFDGSDDAGPVEINSFIGAKFAKGEAPSLRKDTSFKPVSTSPIDTSLLGPGWKVRMAFFPTLTSESSSDYELTMTFHENGVISDMIIEYGDFTVRQKLVALEKVKADSCKN